MGLTDLQQIIRNAETSYFNAVDQLQESLSAIEEAISSLPDDDWMQADAAQAKGKLLERLLLFDEAEAEFLRSLQINIDSGETLSADFSRLVLGEHYLVTRQFQKAIEASNSSTLHETKLGLQILKVRFEAYLSQNDYQSAKVVADEIFNLIPPGEGKPFKQAIHDRLRDSQLPPNE